MTAPDLDNQRCPCGLDLFRPADDKSKETASCSYRFR